VKRFVIELTVAVIGILIAMAAGSLLVLIDGESPLHVWGEMIAGTLFDRVGFAQVLFKATPFVLTGLSVAVALRVGLFNIGVEGQMVAGLLAGGVVGAALPDGTPAIVAVPCVLAAAAAAGALLGAFIGVLKVWRGAHEVIVSIMMNAIVAGVALYAGGAGLFVGETTRTHDVIASAQLPDLGVAGSSLSLAGPLVIVVAIAVGLFFARTRAGFEWRAVGLSPGAARTAGIGVERAVVIAMAASGALGGLTAMHYVLGYKHAYEDGLGRGAGFLGLAVALLGRGSAAGIVVAALLFGFLAQGGLAVAGIVPKEIVDVLQAVIILAVAAAAPATRRALERSLA
jgi:ABC-type uncharacterized transport system permease subunit